MEKGVIDESPFTLLAFTTGWQHHYSDMSVMKWHTINNLFKVGHAQGLTRLCSFWFTLTFTIPRMTFLKLPLSTSELQPWLFSRFYVWPCWEFKMCDADGRGVRREWFKAVNPDEIRAYQTLSSLRWQVITCITWLLSHLNLQLVYII